VDEDLVRRVVGAVPGQLGALVAHLGAEQPERLVVVEVLVEDRPERKAFLASSGRRQRIGTA
jgi:hypothetical protein